MVAHQTGKVRNMAAVNFYNETPSDKQIASDLSNGELVVFNHMTTGAQQLAGEVEALVDFDFIMHNENTIPKWKGADYFVMVPSSIGYPAKREALRALAAAWVAAGCPDQVKRI